MVIQKLDTKQVGGEWKSPL